jgi:hypothetical protein
MSWDPSIILGFKQYTGPDPDQTARTLSQLGLQDVQRQHAQASLSDLLDQQGRTRSLRGIYASNAGNPQSLASALATAGFPEEAAQATKAQQAQLQQKFEMSARALSGVKDDAGLAAAKQAMIQGGVSPEYVAQLGDSYEQAKPQIDAFVKFAIPAEKQAEMENKTENARIVAGQKVTDTGTGQRMQFNPDTGAYDIAVGAPKPPKPAAPEGGKPLSQKDVAQQFELMRKALSTTEGRSHLAMPLQQSINRAEALEALVKDQTGKIINLNPGQTREATTALAQLISQGNAPALQQIEEMTPHTMAGELAKFKQKWLNEPVGTDGQKFLAQILETAAREKAVALRQIREAQLQNIPAFAHLRKADQKKFESMLRAPGVGIDPATVDENGLLIQAPAADAGDIALEGPAGKRLQELRAAAAAKANAGGK